MGHNFRQNKQRRKNYLVYGFIFFFSALLIFSLFMIVRIYRKGNQEQAAFDKLLITVEKYRTEQKKDDGQPGVSLPVHTDPSETSDPTFQSPYTALHNQNPDFVGWLYLSNTKIDYPVMCTPDEPEYYLHRAFDGTSSSSGTPFIGAGDDIDSDCFIIYGHNMKNDSMFGTLDKFKSKEFWTENPAFSFTTTTEEREYAVFAAVQTRILSADEAGYRYYEHSGNLTEAEYDELIGYLKENALYDTGITPAYGEQIVILSTCSYHTENGRFLIAARSVE